TSALSALYCAFRPRVALSLPTRRSSDLSQEATEHLPTQVTLTQLLDVNLGHRPFELQRRWRHTNTRHDISLAAPIGADTHETVRSEEHTSELQSRFELVCRLVLEIEKSD